MPTVRKYGPDEVQDLVGPRRTQRHIIAEIYDTLLTSFDVGDYGEAELEETETKQLVRWRLREAAIRKGVDIEFITTANNTVMFRIVESSQLGMFTQTAQPELEQAEEREVSV
jgi:hypothetical protein